MKCFTVRKNSLTVFSYLLDCDEILQRFRHLAASNCKVARVQEITSPSIIIIVRLRLSKFIVVVWELEVIPTRVNIHGLSKDSRGHYRTLNVPAWPSKTPRTRPGRLTRLGLLP